MADNCRASSNERVIASKRYQEEIKRWLGKQVWGWFEDADPKKCCDFNYGIVTAVLDTGEEDQSFVYEITGICLTHGRFGEEMKQGLRPAYYMINDYDDENNDTDYEVHTARCMWIAENIWPLHEDEYADGK